jgi:hypothetical protein
MNSLALTVRNETWCLIFLAVAAFAVDQPKAVGIDIAAPTEHYRKYQDNKKFLDSYLQRLGEGAEAGIQGKIIVIAMPIGPSLDGLTDGLALGGEIREAITGNAPSTDARLLAFAAH